MWFGLPPTGLIGEIWGLGQWVLAKGVDGKLPDEAKGEAGKVADAAGGLLRQREETSPPKEIRALRATFEETLEELGVTLVVMIEDLDRCLPETTISTLEAIRLFLFLKNTALDRRRQRNDQACGPTKFRECPTISSSPTISIS
jgi:hypothetical protein